jgi:serine/threonine-protein kinase HipA
LAAEPRFAGELVVFMMKFLIGMIFLTLGLICGNVPEKEYGYQGLKVAGGEDSGGEEGGGGDATGTCFGGGDGVEVSRGVGKRKANLPCGEGVGGVEVSGFGNPGGEAMNTLDVWLHGAMAGVLTQDGDGPQRFVYDAGWLGLASAVPLSRQLPLRAEAFTGRPVRAFFSGILPEAETRERVAALFGVSAGNDLALLERMGGECAGAVSIHEEGAAERGGESGGVQCLDAGGLAKIVEELPRRPLLAGMEGVRLSLAGAQVKLPVVVGGGGEIGLPLGSTASTHILKPEPARFPGLAANEAFCMALARGAGLDAADAGFLVVGQTPCLLVRRYDRVVSPAGEVGRIHQEDFCQALGIPPERKYQKEGGPSLRDCIGLLREWSTLPVHDIRNFLDAVIFFVLTGNADAHAKNFSFLYEAGSRRMAPLYDQVCTLAWAELSGDLSMKVGSAWKLAEVSPEHFQQLARETGLGWALVRGRVADLCGRILETVEILPGPEPAAEGVWRKLSEFVCERAKRMLRLCGQ